MAVKIAGTVIGLALAWAGFREVLGPTGPSSLLSRKATTPAEEIEFARQEQQSRDLETLKAILKKKSITENEIFGALVRLGQSQDLEARTYGLKQLSHANSKIRQGIAHALGSFDDPLCLASLRKLAQDPVEEVRIQAIHSLGRKPANERGKILEEILSTPSLPLRQKIEALRSLFQASDGPSAPQQKKRAIQDLLAEIKNPAETSSQAEALRAVTALAPRAPEVLQLLHKRLPLEKNPGIAANTILHLGIVGDPWLKENLKLFTRSREPQIQLAALRVLPLICPPDRRKILEEFIQDSKASLSALASHPAQDPCESMKK